MNKKYVLQAFELNLKGRFDVLLSYYGDTLFNVPAQIVVTQIKDELGIALSEQSIYTLKKRIKKAKMASLGSAAGQPTLSSSALEDKKFSLSGPDQDIGTIVENATKEPKGKKDSGMDFTNF